jgi:molybdopterin converting factor small subunit
MIHVQLLNFVALKAPPERRRFLLDHRHGLTAREIVRSEGLSEADVQMVLVNGLPRGLDAELADGDRVALSALIGGG